MSHSEKYMCFPGRIVSFDPSTQLAEVQISIEKEFDTLEQNSFLRVRDPIIDVPVHVISGGGWHLTVPIKAGDTCTIFFSQVGYDYWLYQDKDEVGMINNMPNPIIDRSFDINDGFAVVGFNTIPRAIPAYNMAGAEFRGTDRTKQRITLNDDSTITVVSDSHVTIDCPSTVITGNVEIQGDLSVAGDTGLHQTLSVDGQSTMHDDVEVYAEVNCDSFVTSSAQVNGNISVTGAGDIGGKDFGSHTHNYTIPAHPVGDGPTTGVN